MRRRFFVDVFARGKARLTGDAARHLARVLRAEPGQLYDLSDGKSVFLARIERVADSWIDFTLVEELPAPSSSTQISLLLAIVKFGRFEWALEKATELGVNAIFPLAAERSERSLVSAAPRRSVRWQKILLEATQQARRLRPPYLHGVTRPASAFVENEALLKVLFSERSVAAPVRTIFNDVAPNINEGEVPLRIVLAVGPEGGWTDQELQAASTAGFREASLGQNILRTETAVIAGLAAAHLFFDAESPVEPGWRHGASE